MSNILIIAVAGLIKKSINLSRIKKKKSKNSLQNWNIY